MLVTAEGTVILTESNLRKVVFSLILLILGLIMIRTAWVCDDAFIAFRSVDNLINGYGLTWNVAERVQAFTNPLWVLLMAALGSITGELYYTTIFTSIFLSLTAAWLLISRICLSVREAILCGTVLLFSKAFIDFSTSGLENPLTYLLLAVFVGRYFTDKRDKSDATNLFWLCFVAALAAVNRLDMLLLYLPALAVVSFSLPWRRALPAVTLGFSPLVVWESFSLIYYGFPFPNTYYAKLHSGVPTIDMMKQGLLYFLDSANDDPLTMMAIAAALIVVAIIKPKATLPLAMGVVLYLLYTIRIGGDFMSGRFFTAPLFLSTMLVGRVRLPADMEKLWWPVAIVVLIGFCAPHPNVISNSNVVSSNINGRGIADERSWYYNSTGLLRDNRQVQQPNHEWYRGGEQARIADVQIEQTGVSGFYGYAAGPSVHLADSYALSEPLLARIPAKHMQNWRIGHFSRHFPDGYFETLKTGENVIADPSLARYYDHLRLITQGDIWSRKRLSTIWRMNWGEFDHLLSSLAECDLQTVNYVTYAEPRPQGTIWNAVGNIVFCEDGVRIQLDSMAHNRLMEISVDHNDGYWLAYRRNDSDLFRQTIEPELIPSHGLRVDTIEVPPLAHRNGYNEVDIIPWMGDGLYSLGHLRLLPDSTNGVE